MVTRARKRPPAHPGRILRNHYLEPLSMTVTDMARVLDVSRKTASKIVNERGSVTSDMALRVSRAFNTTIDPQVCRWLVAMNAPARLVQISTKAT